MALRAMFVEAGAGFPEVGDYVEGEALLWRVVSIQDRIHDPRRHGEGQYCYGAVEAADWDDDDGGTYPCRVKVTPTVWTVDDANGNSVSQGLLSFSAAIRAAKHHLDLRKNEDGVLIWDDMGNEQWYPRSKVEAL